MAFRILTAVVAIAFASGIGLFIAWRSDDGGQQVDATSRILGASRALRNGRFEEAERLALGAAEQHPQAWLIAGEAATKLGRLEQALEYYRRVPEDGSEASVTALYCSGDIQFHLGNAGRAEQLYRRVLAERPGDILAHEQIGKLLCLFGRRWESLPHLLAQVRSGHFTTTELLWLGNVHGPMEAPPDIERYRSQATDDALPFIAMAQAALHAGDFSVARRLAEHVVSLNPGQIEAWAVLGQALFEDSPDSLPEWDARVPRDADDHPDVWLVRGLWRAELDRDREAARCFWEAVLRAPNHREANYRLGQLLVRLGDDERAQPFLDRADRLGAFQDSLIVLHRNPDSAVHLQRAAELSESLGRLWEAAAWYRMLLQTQPSAIHAAERLQELVPRLHSTIPMTLVEANPAIQIRLPDYPLPGQYQVPDAAGPPPSAAVPHHSARFEDMASRSGIDFRYFNGSDPHHAGKRVFQPLGGGVGVLDYDLDGWPDLYFAQGAQWPPDDADRTYQDQLYRNQATGQFLNVTHASHANDPYYSHGVAVGDIDNDGFPDLYVANEGRNRLYQNNGDGTFREITDAAGIQGEQCTTSCLLADLNGDSLPDIYDVNYLAAPEVHELICRRNGNPHSCSPRQFDAEPDRLFLNLKNGRFEDISRSCGVDLPHGKGLGILAADFSGDGRLSLFVANDTDANFCFENQTASAGGHPLFRDTAAQSGLAFDAEGRALACMGIAAADADGDGLLDLFVTNFHRESNTLYRQLETRLFADATSRSGLRAPSLGQLGFGTQFLDGELDGWPDLVVANGHIEDYREEGTPYQMRPQYFRNLAGRFEEAPAATLGPYFSGAYLGRGVARLDWNRDGREDFAVSHLDAPAALLTNVTSKVGHHLVVRLVATSSSRDAIGATVTLNAGERRWMRQLTAGDGYMSANERQLVFGVGAAEGIRRLEVRWPSGMRQVWHDLATDQNVLVVEGRDEPLVLERGR
jgi:tetratricopeptide (TPR) repeat protein